MKSFRLSHFLSHFALALLFLVAYAMRSAGRRMRHYVEDWRQFLASPMVPTQVHHYRDRRDPAMASARAFRGRIDKRGGNAAMGRWWMSRAC